MEKTDTDLDQADEEILSHTVSDEALEAAAGTEGGPTTLFTLFPQCAADQLPLTRGLGGE